MDLIAKKDGIPVTSFVLVKKYWKYQVKKVAHEWNTYYFATTPEGIPITKAIKIPNHKEETIKKVLKWFKEVYKLWLYKTLTNKLWN